MLTGDRFHLIVLFDLLELFSEFLTELGREHVAKRNEVRPVEQSVVAQIHNREIDLQRYCW